MSEKVDEFAKGVVWCCPNCGAHRPYPAGYELPLKELADLRARSERYAELMEADKRYDAAEDAYTRAKKAFAREDSAFNEAWRDDRREDFETAKKRRAAAIAACTPGEHT